jgi:hypothetical protein
LKRTALFIAAEFLWGAAWAVFLQNTRLGRYLAGRKTWTTVIVGVGGTLALAYPVIEEKSWWRICQAFALSSTGIIVRSIVNEQRLERALHGAE